MKTNNGLVVYGFLKGVLGQSARVVLFIIVSFFGVAIGEELPANDSVQNYPREFFNRFNPQTAEDMIARLPGFVLDTGEQVRGFGGAAGNVLVDGGRPTAKSGGIGEILRRIPADTVLRIEIIRGTAGASEAAGQALVANIIREKDAASGSWSLSLNRSPEGPFFPIVDIAYSQPIKGWQTSSKLNLIHEDIPLEGLRRTLDAQDNLLLSQDESRDVKYWEGSFATEVGRQFDTGRLTLNGRIAREALLIDVDRFQFRRRLPNGPADRRFFIDSDSKTNIAELSAEWLTKTKRDWDLKLLSLVSFQGLDDLSIGSSEEPVGTVDSVRTFQGDQDNLEAVIRGTLSRERVNGWAPEFGVEFAFNGLDSKLALLDVRNGLTTEILLPSANVKVEENRGEAFANFNWQVRKGFDLEMGITVEYSDIEVTGDTENRQNFLFFKPFATLIWNVSEGLQYRLSARRTVGQLDFADFAASAEAENDRQFAGNPSLQPERTTRIAFTVDWRPSNWGAYNLEAFYERRTDVLEQRLLPSGGAGLGNIGSADVWGYELQGSLPLNRYLTGGLLEFQATVQGSLVTDPFTGERRSITGQFTPNLNVSFRQDLTKYKVSWGLNLINTQSSDSYFADEVSFGTDRRSIDFFVETTRFWGVRTRLDLSNIGNLVFERERRFFTPDRSQPLDSREFIRWHRGTFIGLTFFGQF